MSPFFIRWVVTTLAVMVVCAIPWTGVRTEGLMPLLLASLLLGLFNAFVRPVLLLLSLPLILFSMGLFILVVNAVLLLVVGSVVPGFTVSGFWAALFGSILISIVSWILSILFRGSDGRFHVITHPPAGNAARKDGIKKVEGRVIE